jgi:hypothetical protein
MVYSFIPPEGSDIINSVAEAIPPRQGTAVLHDGSALSKESNALMNGIRNMNKVSGVSRFLWPNLVELTQEVRVSRTRS